MLNWKTPAFLILSGANAYLSYTTHNKHKKNEKNEKELKTLITHVKSGKIDLETVAKYTIQELLRLI